MTHFCPHTSKADTSIISLCLYLGGYDVHKQRRQYSSHTNKDDRTVLIQTKMTHYSPHTSKNDTSKSSHKQRGLTTLCSPTLHIYVEKDVRVSKKKTYFFMYSAQTFHKPMIPDANHE